MYELAAKLNFVGKRDEYKTIKVRERIVLRHGSGEKVLRDEVVERSCRIVNGKAVLV
ncbi:MAG: hypothetical protein IJQ34_00445 [Kiritimatiellae bacterium]|nr:hypothetical protein [Kiritimatiellia bacterium]MBR0196584.1 hypothetical protein [Kiritimatiellia bacterium]